MVAQQHPGPKPHQHHVWQEYLRAWSDKDGKVFCLQNNRIFSTGTPVLGAKRNFYKVPSLTDQDLKLIDLLALNKPHALLRSHHELLLENVLGPILFVQRNRDNLNNLPLIDAFIDDHSTNAVDDQHTMIEGLFLPLLPRALKGDIGWYDDVQECIAFCNFIAAQHMRTRGVKERTVRRLQDRMNLDISRIWDILALTYAFNIGCSLFLERKRRDLILICNDSVVPFITGDQPVVNLHGDGETGPDKLSMYYPISPRLALYLGEPNEATNIARGAMAKEAVMELNLLIAKKSFTQIYAHSGAELERVRNQLTRVA